MMTTYRQRLFLRRIERDLCRSDPHLAATLVGFAALYAGEALAGPEQQALVPRRAWLLAAITCLAIALSACAGALVRAVRAVWCRARGHLGAAQQSGARAG